MSQTRTDSAALRASLTFHASFDQGPDADFALGERTAYSAVLPMGAIVTEGTPGIADPSMSIAASAGKYGGALAFTQPSDAILFYRAAHNVAYSPDAFAGTASFWMHVDPAEIGGQYADPFQLTDKIYSDDCIWIDFTKNDEPSDFRLGVFGDRATWDPADQQAFSKEFYWRLAKITEPPFAKDRWTHVVVTWYGLNNTQRGRARLYFDAEYQEASGIIRERFNWDTARATIRLGTGPFVGLIDDLALFNRALSRGDQHALPTSTRCGRVILEMAAITIPKSVQASFPSEIDPSQLWVHYNAATDSLTVYFTRQPVPSVWDDLDDYALLGFSLQDENLITGLKIEHFSKWLVAPGYSKKQLQQA